MFGYGPEHTSFNPLESAISVGNVAGLVRRYPPSNGHGCSSECASPAVAYGSVYFGTDWGELEALDAGDGRLQWSGHTGGALSSPAVVDGVVYVGSSDSKLYAFDATGVTNCSGTPKTCAPLWTANAMDTVRFAPTVANGVVYAAVPGRVLAFSAAGTTNCSGIPKVCNPLWATAPRNSPGRTPAIANGVLYFSGDQLYAFDAAGNINCSGVPKSCQPLWTGWPPSGFTTTPPAVADGVVYVGVRSNFGGEFLVTFSAAGTTNCSGIPKACGPLWAGPITGGQNSLKTTPAVANGMVYISAGDIQEGSENHLTAFDAAGVTNCAPILGLQHCHPLWTAENQASDEVFASWSPAVANGVVYITYQSINTDYTINNWIQAFDASGTINCSGAPKTCSALWSDFVFSDVLSTAAVSSPVVANGAVYLNAGTGAIYKYALPS
jgi:outer membrane protein assembly factor BamB